MNLDEIFEAKEKWRGKLGKMERRGIETVALHTCIDLKESIYISVLSKISSSRGNKENRKISDRISSRFLVTRRFIWTFGITFAQERISFPKNWSPLRRKLKKEEDSSLVCQSVSQSVSQFFDEENDGATWTSLVVARKWGVRDWFASVRGSATRHESHLSSLASITGWERVGRWCGRARFELAWWIRELGVEAAFRISTTREMAPVLVPSFHTFLHLRLAISSVSSLADHLLSPFPSLETYPFRFYLLPDPSGRLSSSSFSLLSPRYYSSFARYPLASSLCFFVRFAASSPFLPTPFSLTPSPKTFFESSSAILFPSLLFPTHSSSLCISHSPFLIAYFVWNRDASFSLSARDPFVPVSLAVLLQGFA